MQGTRRELLAALGALPFALAGCGEQNGAERSKLVKLKYWGTGTLDIGPENWARAEDEIGVAVEFLDNGNDLGPVLTRMISGTAAQDYDLGGVQGGAEPELYRAGTILPWDVSRISNWDKIWPNLREGIPYLNAGGEQIGIPVVVNADSMIYRENETGVVDSYAKVFDPAFRGKASMEDSWMNSVIFAAIYMKHHNIDGMASIQEPGNLTEDELNTVIDFLKKHKRDGQFYKFWSGWEEGVDLITSGDVVVMTGWEPIFYEARRRGIADVGYAEPIEGYEGWSNNVVLHAGVRSSAGVERGAEDAAYELVNWLLGGTYGCILGDLSGYMVPTPNCVDLLNSSAGLSYIKDGEERGVSLEAARQLGDHVRSKLEDHKGGVYWQNARPDNYALYERLWAELRVT